MAINKDEARQIHPGTDVTRRILDRLGSPDKKLKIIHIAGTNGKGSTAEYIMRILLAAGKKVGAFTSPAAYGYFEQFRVDGVPILEAEFGKYLGAASAAAEGFGATPFELETAAAVYAFAQEGCEYAVVECGMGGRDDATNAIAEKVLAVITSVSLEHTDYLGNTLEEICAHKTGIIKGCPAVACPFQSEEAARLLKERGVPLAEPPSDIIQTETGQSFTVGGKRYETIMLGAVQPYNAATAIAAAQFLGIDGGAVRQGVKNAELGGRIETVLSRGKRYILDGAHNPASFYPLAEYVKNLAGSKAVIYGCLSDKDTDGNLAYLAPCADKITAVKPDSPRAMDYERIKQSCKKYFSDVAEAQSVGSALAAADGDNVIVCGSFTLLKEAKEWIEKR